MKIRNGFVSNSSSSSFVLVVRKNEYDKVKNACDPLYQIVMDAVMSPTNIFGNECMEFSSNSGDYQYDYIDLDEMVEKVKALAIKQGRPASSDEYFPTAQDEQDDWLRDAISDGLYEVKYSFNSVPKDKQWSCSQDW